MDEVETTATKKDTNLNDVDVEQTGVLFIDPYDSTTYDADNYEIELVHTFTLGDVLIATLLSILIVVMLLSRLLGRSVKW